MTENMSKGIEKTNYTQTEVVNMRKFEKKRANISRQWLLPAILGAGILGVLIWGLTGGNPDFQTAVKANNLIFSEICTKNETIIADNDGAYRDYVELYNGGGDVDLKGYCLTDGQSRSKPFGELYIPSGSYCLLFLDKDVTGFSLKSSGGECLSLVSPAGRVVAQVNTVAMSNDQVMLYTATDYLVSGDATPGFSNDSAGLQAFRKGKVNENPTLLISEVLTENMVGLSDEKGRFSDIVELYNSSADPVFLGEYCLSDSVENRFRFRLPAVMLQPGAYALVYCDGENYIGENGEIHTGFGLSSGDVLCLTDRSGAYTAVDLQFPGADTSWALNSDGKYGASALSLGYANTQEGITAFHASRVEESADLVISELLLSFSDVPYQGGLWDVVEIWNRSNKPVDTANWHLSDGKDPYSYALPNKTLAPNERMVIRCSRTDTGFSLSRGETLYLIAPSGKWASQILCDGAQAGESIQLLASGEAYTCGGVSLGFENTAAGIEAYEKNSLPQGLRISELMSANTSYIKGAYGKTWDWIELYNGGSEAVNLKDYTFSTDSGELGAYPLPDKTLKPGEYCVILLSDRDDSYPSGYLRLPVSLSSSGEAVYLSKNGVIADGVVIPALMTDISYGRARGDGRFLCLSTPTPAQRNTGGAEVSVTPETLTAQGIYESDGVDVTLSGKGKIYYTTDSTIPTANSIPYTGPIHLSSTTVIRAVAIEPGKLASQTLDLTYVINEGHQLPVVSLVTEPDNLWSEEKGICAMGPGASPEFPHKGANFWQDWERPITVSLLEKDGVAFSQAAGISIHGAYSRARALKGFAIAFRDSYGKGSLDYPLFGEDGLERFESFVLRASGQDDNRSRMRDVLMTSLVGEYTTVAVQDYRPVVLYINGEFWGVYYIREKARESYVAGHYNVDQSDVILTGANGVDTPEYMDVLYYAHEQDLSKPEHYEYVTSRVDIENYMDYIIAEMYIANPDNGNIRYFKTTDGKWKWIMYDTDYGFSSAGHNTVWEHLNPAGTGSGDNFSTKMINGLLKNPEFKEQFIRRIAWQINNIWTEENVNARIDELESLIAHDMKRDCAKQERNYSHWQSYVSSLRSFAPARNKQLPKLVQQHFGLTDAQMREYGFVM